MYYGMVLLAVVMVGPLLLERLERRIPAPRSSKSAPDAPVPHHDVSRAGDVSARRSDLFANRTLPAPGHTIGMKFGSRE